MLPIGSIVTYKCIPNDENKVLQDYSLVNPPLNLLINSPKFTSSIDSSILIFSIAFCRFISPFFHNTFGCFMCFIVYLNWHNSFFQSTTCSFVWALAIVVRSDSSFNAPKVMVCIFASCWDLPIVEAKWSLLLTPWSPICPRPLTHWDLINYNAIHLTSCAILIMIGKLVVKLKYGVNK